MVVDGLRRVPPWGWLSAIVVASFLIRAWLARGMVAPFIMVDELIYSELGRSIADDLALRVRDVEAGGFSVVYPLLISPAYALFENLPDAYAAVKTLNSLYMSLAAIPAYFLARRVLGPRARAVRGAAHGGGALARLHGHRDDGERVLPALPDRLARARARPRTADADEAGDPARAGRARVRAPACRPWRSCPRSSSHRSCCRSSSDGRCERR